MALTGSSRISGVTLVDAVGIEVPVTRLRISFPSPWLRSLT